MDSTEFNKIAGAGLAALLIFLLLNFFSAQIYGTREAGHEGEEAVLAYALAVETEGAGEAAEEPQVDLAALVAEADPAAGESAFRPCTACHKLEEGANAVGPHLFDVVGRDIAAVESFSYSDALLALEGDWTLEHLSGFLEDPRAYAPGTKMAFAGIKDPQDRVNVIAYLNEVGGTPVDLAEGLEPVAAAGDAAADAGAPAAEGGATAPIEAVTEGVDQNVGGEVTGQTVVDTEEADVPTSPAAETQETEVEGEPALDVTDPRPEAPVQQLPETAGAPGEGADPLEGAPEAGVPSDVILVPGQEAPPDRVAGDEAPPQSPPGEALPTDPERQLSPDAREEDAARQQAPAAEQPAEQPGTGAEVPAADQGAADQGAADQGAGAGQEQVAAAPAAPAAEGGDAGTGFAGGDAAAGEKVFRRCAACHKVEEGAHGVGPSLWGVVGRDIAAADGYSYSDAMAAHEGEWTPDLLSDYLENPKAVVPGTKMAFPGLKKEQDRIDVITYLNEQSDAPISLE